MEEVITIKTIFMLSSILVTYIFGIIAKKFNLIESKYIPIQNLIIGILAGILSYVTKLNDNIITSVIGCLICSMSAGGIYDTLKTRKGD